MAVSVHVRSILLPRDPHHEFVRVMTHATVEKRTDDYDDALKLYLVRGASRFEAEAKAARAIRPYEVLVGDYKAMVDNGIDLALLLLVGGAGTAFNNANARLGVGDSATAWATTQADLVAATNRLRKGMNATYPVTGTTKQTFRSGATLVGRGGRLPALTACSLGRRGSRRAPGPCHCSVRSDRGARIRTDDLRTHARRHRTRPGSRLRAHLLDC